MNPEPFDDRSLRKMSDVQVGHQVMVIMSDHLPMNGIEFLFYG